MEHRAWLLIKFMFVVRHICIRDRVWWWTTALKLASTWSHAHQALLQLGARFLRLHVCLILRNRSVCLGTLTTSKNLFKRQSSLIFYHHLLCFFGVKDYAFLAQMEAGSSAEMIFDFLIEARHPCGTTSTTASQIGQATLESFFLCCLLHLIIMFKHFNDFIGVKFWCTKLH